MQQETGEGDKVQSRQHRGQALIVASQPSEAGQPGETALNHPAAGQQDKAAFGAGQPDDFQVDAVSRCGVRHFLAGIALIDPGQFDVLARHRLHLPRQRLDLSALVLVGRRDHQREQQPQGIDRRMGLGSLAALMATVARAGAALGRRLHPLHHPRIEDGRRRLASASGSQPHQQPQIVHQRLKAARRQPAARLLVDGGPGWKVGRQQAPGSACAHDPAQRIEDFTQRIAPLQRLFRDQRQVGGDQRPLLVADIGRIGFPGRRDGIHAACYHLSSSSS